MKKGSKEMFSSERKEKRRKKAGFRRVFLLSGLMLLLLSGCGGSRSSETVIDGRSFYEAGKEVERLHIEKTIGPQREKYLRHYTPMLYFEDLEKEKQELGEAFYRHWHLKIKRWIKTRAPLLKDLPWILHTEVEFVNEDVKKYREGSLSAEEIIENPDSILRISMEWHMFFETPEKNQAALEKFHQIERLHIAKEVTETYIDSNIEQVEFWAYANRAEALKEFSLQQLQESENIRGLLGSRYGLFGDAQYLKMPYRQSKNDAKSFKDIHDYINGEGEVEPEKALTYLQEKYRIPFYQKSGQWFAAEAYPDLFFSLEKDGSDEDLEDYFLGALYQELLQRQIEQIIEEEGLGEELLFFVTVEPRQGVPFEERNPCMRPYDCRQLEEEAFLKDGYGGDVDVTLIALTDSPQVYEREAQHESALKKKLRRVLERIDEKIRFGRTAPFVENGKEYKSGYKTYYLYEYLLDKEEQRIAKELFQKYRRTEHCRREDVPGLADDFSLSYVTRADTPAFHYLDIFGEKLFEGCRNFFLSRFK